jgi:uncharacterized membrane protein (Fun14 family)
MVEIITPILTQLGVGGIAGLCVGFALKKIGKLLAILLGIAFLFLQYLAYIGIISINYSALQEWAKGVAGQASAFEGVLTAIIANLPFSASFLLGFALGFKMG